MYGAQLTPYLALSVAVQKQNKKQTTLNQNQKIKSKLTIQPLLFLYIH